MSVNTGNDEGAVNTKKEEKKAKDEPHEPLGLTACVAFALQSRARTENYSVHYDVIDQNADRAKYTPHENEVTHNRVKQK
jgi:hypothetical protein